MEVTGSKRSHDNTLGGSKAIRRGKVLVLYALLFCAAGFGVATYLFTVASETTNFTTSFEVLAGEILATSERHLRQEVSLLTSFSSSITSLVSSSPNLEWPFVTVPNYEARAQETLGLTGMERITFVPIVPFGQISEWEDYTLANQWWMRQSLDYHGQFDLVPATVSANLIGVNPNAYNYVAPIWQVSPVDIKATLVNYDKFDLPWFKILGSNVQLYRRWLLSEEVDLSGVFAGDEPRGMICHPVHEEILKNPQDSKVVAFLNGAFAWGGLFRNVMQLPEEKFVIEIEDTCGAPFTYVVTGPDAVFLGRGLFHDPKYDDMRESRIMVSSRTVGSDEAVDDIQEDCRHIFHIFPTNEFEGSFRTKKAWIYLFVVEGAFAFTTLVFVIYDYTVRQRQTKLKDQVESASAIVNSLFPKNVQHRILEEQQDHTEFGSTPQKGGAGENLLYTPYGGQPIADLFSQVTILFADIAGFTAWSSTREPEHVFSLLENIYFAFDEIAQAHKVFKVETVGDCYVAACGLPDYNPNHHLVMSRFACKCMRRFTALKRELVASMGPDVIALGLRVGIHSGPVTAGVLRGDRARFQLFGDAMNTTARIETTGERDKIHLSQETADLLIRSGKDHWLAQRENKVEAKGKGLLQTFWLSIPSIMDAPNEIESSVKFSPNHDNSIATGTATHLHNKDSLSERRNILVDWLVEILSRKLRELARYRAAMCITPDTEAKMARVERNQINSEGLVSDEISETVKLPKFSSAKRSVDPKILKLSDEVIRQLRDYIESISKLYYANDFHNFEHATHVTMSVNKLFHRIIGPVIASQGGHTDVSPTLHEQTYGIASDPLTRFTIHLSALIHDVDHAGVPNSQLVTEGTPVAQKFQNKSVAEQNSVVKGWQLLMKDKYKALRRAIYTNEADFTRFRQLLVNIVMATDIMDKDLKALRNRKWEAAFERRSGGNKNRSHQATVVLEHLMQASDVAHTMQHWHVYLKWNRRLFKEMYKAYQDGRSTSNPLDNWYKGEIGFFDFYIIPLAKKLKDCGVFGVASEEYLTYAMQNRREWAEKGQEVVREYSEMVKFGDDLYDC